MLNHVEMFDLAMRVEIETRTQPLERAQQNRLFNRDQQSSIWIEAEKNNPYLLCLNTSIIFNQAVPGCPHQ